MEKMTVLGTGAAMVTKCYNTCFTISDDNEHFLVDAGGGNTILSNLDKSNITIAQIHNMFISHNHNDHILGAIWIIRAVAQSISNGNYKGNLNIYCHENSIKALKCISSFVLNNRFTKFFNDRIIFIPIQEGDKHNILGREIIFFDIKSTKDLQFGFKVKLLNGKELTFLGDEPYRESIKAYSENVDYLLHESYCIYEHRHIFKPYEKHHVTVKEACENAEILNAKAVVLYHTEDKNLEKRKELYSKEGSRFFSGDIYVPYDLDIIVL